MRGYWICWKQKRGKPFWTWLNPFLSHQKLALAESKKVSSALCSCHLSLLVERRRFQAHSVTSSDFKPRQEPMWAPVMSDSRWSIQRNFFLSSTSGWFSIHPSVRPSINDPIPSLTHACLLARGPTRRKCEGTVRRLSADAPHSFISLDFMSRDDGLWSSDGKMNVYFIPRSYPHIRFLIC